jgi:hypothetical protein
MTEAATYWNARNALLLLQVSLKKSSSWQNELRPLHDNDIKILTVAAFDDDNTDYINGSSRKNQSKRQKRGERESEGRKKTSWIWMSHGVSSTSASDDHTHDSACFFSII